MEVLNRFIKSSTVAYKRVAYKRNLVYSHLDPIKFLTKTIESSLYDYSDAYILVTGNIIVKRRNAPDNADIAL